MSNSYINGFLIDMFYNSANTDLHIFGREKPVHTCFPAIEQREEENVSV